MAVLTDVRARQVHWLRAGLGHARRVARVDVRGRGFGSGLLLDGVLLDPALADVPLLLTAWHVFHNIDGTVHSEPNDATVLLEGMLDDRGEMPSAKIKRVLVQSPYRELNFTLALLDRLPGKVPRSLVAPQLPEPDDKVYIFGHPGGAGLAVTLEDNEVITKPTRRTWENWEDYLFYRAATEGGSSGSPVFNEHWELVALHVGGDRSAGTNYGVPIQKIIDFIRTSWTSNPEPFQQLKAWRPEAASAAADVTQPDYFSVFISYSHADSVFANRLHEALQSKGIRAWFDNKDMRLGDDIYEQIDRGITHWDKVLLCGSKNSLNSWWVDSEIDRVFQKERELFRKSGRKVLALIPLMIDDYLLDSWDSAKAQEVKSRIAGDFRGWQEKNKFDTEFAKLLASLRSDAGGRQEPPPSKL